MYVMKFGAVSVSDPQRLQNLVEIVRAETYQPLAIVCTAMSGVTDLLIGAARGAVHGDEETIEMARRELWSRHRALAERIVRDEWEREELYRHWAELLKTFDRFTRSLATLGESSLRGIDAVASLGERFTAHLVAVALRQGGIAAQMVDAAEMIVTDDHFGSARPFHDESLERIHKRLRALLQAHIVPVITGYTGATREGFVTTLGRGGGDYTAALIGAAIKAAEVCIWTDVDGIMTADPKSVPKAHTLQELSYREATEVATFGGAEVLHPRTLEPLMAQGITLAIRNVLRSDHRGTRIVARPQPTAHFARAIISARSLSMLTLATRAGAGWTPALASQALAELTDAGIEILTFAQSFSDQSLKLSMRSSDAAFAQERLTSIFLHERSNSQLEPVEVTAPVALIAVISATDNHDLMPHTLAALGSAGAHVMALSRGATSPHISFVLPDEEVDVVVQALHEKFRLA
jgi:aspartate kinase